MHKTIISLWKQKISNKFDTYFVRFFFFLTLLLVTWSVCPLKKWTWAHVKCWPTLESSSVDWYVRRQIRNRRFLSRDLGGVRITTGHMILLIGFWPRFIKTKSRSSSLNPAAETRQRNGFTHFAGLLEFFYQCQGLLTALPTISSC